MPEIINNGKELLRINRTKNIIEFSRTDREYSAPQCHQWHPLWW